MAESEAQSAPVAAQERSEEKPPAAATSSEEKPLAAATSSEEKPAAAATSSEDKPPVALSKEEGDAEEARVAAEAEKADEDASPAAPTASDEPVAPVELAAARDASPAPATEAVVAGEGTPNAAADAAAKPEESIPARVAHLWTEFAKKDEKLAEADRLTVSSAYRQWLKTAELGLPEGADIPPFTEVWLALNSKPAKAKLKPAPTRDGGDGKRGDAGDSDRWNAKFDADGEEMCGDFKRGRCWRGGDCRYSHNVDGGKARRRSRSRSRRMGKARGGDDSKDPLADFAAEVGIKVYSTDGTCIGDPADVKAIKDDAAEASGDKGGDDGPKGKGEPDGSLALERELDRRAAQKANSSRLDEPLMSARDEKRRRPENSRPEFSHNECVDMFDNALRQICQEGLQRELPVAASVFNDRMRRLYQGWHIEASPFQRYGDLLEAAEGVGLVKVTRTGSQLSVSWIKYKYHVQAPKDGPPWGQRDGPPRDGPLVRDRCGRSQSRPRRERPAGHDGGGPRERERGGPPERERGRERDRARGRPERALRNPPDRGGGDRGRARGGGGDRGREPRERMQRSERERPKGRGGGRERRTGGKERKRSPSVSSSEYSYSYEYTDQESYSASPSPKRKAPRERRRR